MIVLDTNVLSELIRPMPAQKVLAWLEAQPLDRLFTTVISRAEMLYGVRIQPAGRRREKLLRAVKDIFSTDMAGRVLPYDEAAADAYADIAAQRRALGLSSGLPDLMIAGIARSHGATLARSNARNPQRARPYRLRACTDRPLAVSRAFSVAK